MPDISDTLVSQTTQIVSAHVSHNAVPPDALPELIKKVYTALGNLARGVTIAEPKTPAIPIKQSLRQDSVICLDCGKPFKMLKRHLMADHKMTPELYREQWGLPASYPMVAPTYAKTRSSLAKQIGLGTRRAGPKSRKRKAG